MLKNLLTFLNHIREFDNRLKNLEAQNLMILERIQQLEVAHQEIKDRAALERQQVQGVVENLTGQIVNLELQVQELKDLLSLEDQEVAEAVAALDVQIAELQGIAADISAIYEEPSEPDSEVPEIPETSELV